MKNHLSYEIYTDYDEYIKSHDFERVIRKQKEGTRTIVYECPCGAIKLTPSGTIDFKFACAIEELL